MHDRASAPQTWDRLAVRYGAQERFELRAIDAALRLAAPTSDDRLVDLATGTALLLRRLALSPTRPSAVLGVERSRAMLAQAGALPPGWATLLADPAAVPLPDDWASIVTCTYLLHLLDGAERAQVLAEARRLLRPGPTGRLVVVTVCPDERRAGGRLAGRALRLLARARPQTWGGLRPLDPSADLAAAGFAITRRQLLPRRGYPSLVLLATDAIDPEKDAAEDEAAGQ